ncbi:MAG: peptidoglycan editing factor PgeF [Nitrospinaceae bacterium]|nr:peptidoglycan editing factor PgeF [Nitrospinaceae bacterium]NIR54400.1 peptidoglycan editing factor PgeF [Nitrospinaceae bacterium]NIS84814.1 peptidoglycan editing factor PgeF [Nitrospinaceae bacterium]NIT81619.1 peptidoglycan editing factor PgeF [Nitrospinaceae bacterium]NIU43902.1 peptidoglycan editing factor PgeF [Nitrospinaceae bacterium]
MKNSGNFLSIDKLNRFPQLVHAFSPREFVNEAGEREEFLLGRPGDPKTSARHRTVLFQMLSLASNEIYFTRQVHGDRVFVLNNPELLPAQVELEEADALITHLTGKPIAVLTADCVPILLYDPDQHVAGVVHAGRKGTQRAIISKVISMMVKVYGVLPDSLRLAMGPAIGGCCYEVGEDCIEPFRRNFPDWKSWITPHSGDKYRLDLLKANEAESVRAGVLPENIFRSGECTSCNNDRWFSYRREGTTGRMVSLAMLLP